MQKKKSQQIKAHDSNRNGINQKMAKEYEKKIIQNQNEN